MKIAPSLAFMTAILLLGAGCNTQKTKISENGTPLQEAKKAPVVQQSVTITTPQAMPSYTMDEVTVHATSTDCWMVIQEKVYDVTSYISKNSNTKTIINGCGKDAVALIPQITDEDPAFKDSLPDYELGLFAK